LLVAVIGDRDRLQQHHAVRLQQRAAFGKVRVVVPMSHRFDHLDRHQFVEFSAQIAVVRE
jgi:hypothetical protein